MKLIHVNSTNPSKVFIEIAEALDTTLWPDKNKIIYRINIPHHIGKGYIEGYAFGKGIIFMNFNCEFYDDLQLSFQVKKTNTAKFHYLMEGQVSGILNHELLYHYNLYQSTVICLSPSTNYVLDFKRYSPTKFSCLDIVYSKFIKKSQSLIKSIRTLKTFWSIPI